MSPLLNRILFITALLVIIPCKASFSYDQNNPIGTLAPLLDEAEKTPPEKKASEEIFLKGDVLFCTGDDPAAAANNRAAEKMLAGEFTAASEILEDALKHSPLFFPFRYNLGICYLHIDRLDRALFNLNRAAAIVPEFSKTYLQIGFVYQLMQRDDEAMDQFRQALKMNRSELNGYIYIGDIYFERGQAGMAKRYYEAALKVDPRFPNGLLGMAKVHYHEKRYIHAINILRAIDISGEYDKSLHYYYAEASYRLRDYSMAAVQFRKLLRHTDDRFFITNSVSLIEHKLEMSERLAGEK